MKKALVLVFALVIAMSMFCTAFAETRTYVMIEVDDAEGNALYGLSDDNTMIVDADGNDVTDQFPILVFSCDDEAMTGAWGTEGADPVACTLTEEDGGDGTVIVTATFEDASTITLVYSQEDDAFLFTTGENICVLANMDA